MTATFQTGWQSFEKMSRRQAIDTSYALESMRDRAIKRTDTAEATLAAIREVLADVRPCDKYDDDDVITCGWKSAVQSIRHVLKENA